MHFTATGPGRTVTAANSRTVCPTTPLSAAGGLPGECILGASVQDSPGGAILTVQSIVVAGSGGLSNLSRGEVFDELRAWLVDVPITLDASGMASGRVRNWSYTIASDDTGIDLRFEGAHTSGCRWPYQRVAMSCNVSFPWPPTPAPPPASWAGMSEMGRARRPRMFVTPTLEPGTYRFTMEGTNIPIMKVRAGYPLVDDDYYGWDVADCTSRGPGSCSIELPIRAPIHVVIEHGPTATDWSDYTITSTGF